MARLGLAALWLTTVGEVVGQRAARPFRHPARRLALQPPHVRAHARVCVHGHRDGGSGHRRDDVGLFRDRLRPDQAAAVSRGRSPRQGLGADAGLRTTGAVARQLSRLDAGRDGVRAHRLVPHARRPICVGKGDPMRVEGAAVSADLAANPRRAAARRSTLRRSADDRDGAPGTVLLSYRLWQTRFGGDPAIVGQQVLLNSESHTVIGVMPREFQFPSSESQLVDDAAIHGGELRRSR